MDEDLHSCIIEQLQKNSVNNRANIMHFIEHLCDMALKANHVAYISMMNRDICEIVDHVAPEDGSGSANVKVVRKVLGSLGAKKHLSMQTVAEIEELLLKRDTKADEADDVEGAEDVEMSGTGNGTAGGSAKGKSNGGGRLDRKLVEQRLEEDRERHKRSRENHWAVPADGGADAEFEKLWEETSDLGDDDFELYREEEEERRRCGEAWMEKHEKLPASQSG